MPQLQKKLPTKKNILDPSQKNYAPNYEKSKTSFENCSVKVIHNERKLGDHSSNDEIGAETQDIEKNAGNYLNGALALSLVKEHYKDDSEFDSHIT